VISVGMEQTIVVVEFVLTKWHFCDVLCAAVKCIAQVIKVEEQCNNCNKTK
jgi:hypothetical protein